MEYFAGLDVSMEETHVCVVDRDGSVVHLAKVSSVPADIERALARLHLVSASCSRPAVWRRCFTTA